MEEGVRNWIISFNLCYRVALNPFREDNGHFKYLCIFYSIYPHTFPSKILHPFLTSQQGLKSRVDRETKRMTNMQCVWEEPLVSLNR